MRKWFDVRRRNRVVSAVTTIVFVGVMLCAFWLMWQVKGRRRPWVLVVFGVGIVVFAVWSWWGARREDRALDRYLESEAIDPSLFPEAPVPVMPPRGQRTELALSFVALVLVAAVTA